MFTLLPYTVGALFGRLTAGGIEHVMVADVQEMSGGFYVLWADGRRDWHSGHNSGERVVLLYGPVTESWCAECGTDPVRHPSSFCVTGSTPDNRSITVARNMRHDDAKAEADGRNGRGWNVSHCVEGF